MSERRVVVTGMGVVSPFGIGAGKFAGNIFAGNSAAALITAFDVSSLPTQFAASLPLADCDLDPLVENQKSLKTLCRAGKFAVIAAKAAVDDAGLDTSRLNPFRFGTSLGAGGLGLEDLEHFNQRLQIATNSIDPSHGPQLEPDDIIRSLGEGLNANQIREQLTVESLVIYIRKRLQQK